MFITVHAAVATIIGKKTNDAAIAFILGFISHFIFDFIPHGDEHMGKKFFGNRLKALKEDGDLKVMAIYGTADSVFLAMFLIYLYKSFSFANSDTVMWAIIGALLPDLNAAFSKLTNWKIFAPLQAVHVANHHFLVKRFRVDFPLRYGIFMQVCIMSALIWIIYAV